MSTFEKEEYKIRISKVRKSMDEKNIEVLIVTDPSNMVDRLRRLVVLCASVRGTVVGEGAVLVWTWNGRQRSKTHGVHAARKYHRLS